MLETAIHSESEAALNHVLVKHPGIKARLAKSHGYIVFPSVGRAGVVIGGAHGHGEVYEEGKPIGFAMLSQITVGIQAGGQTFTELVLFDSKKALEELKHGGKVGFTANASAVMVKAAATGTSNTAGLQAMAFSHGGMLLELSLGGSSFQFVPPMSKPEPGQPFKPAQAPRFEQAPRTQIPGSEQRKADAEQAKAKADAEPPTAKADAEPPTAKAEPEQPKAQESGLHRVAKRALEPVVGGDDGEGVKNRVLGRLGKVLPINDGRIGTIKDQAVKVKDRAWQRAGEAQQRMSEVQHKASRLRLVARVQGTAAQLMGCVKETYGRAFGKEHFIIEGKAQKLQGQALQQVSR